MCPSSYVGFPGDSCGKEPAWQCRRLKRYEIFVCFVFFLKRYEFDPWVGEEDPLEEHMETHCGILAWRAHGQSSLAGYSQ